MKKIAMFFTTWTESGERFLQAAKKLNVELIPIHYSELIFKAIKGNWQAFYESEHLDKFDIFYFRNVGDKIECLPLLLEYAQKHGIKIVDEYLSKIGGAFRKKKSSEAMLLLGSGVSYPKTSFILDANELVKEVESAPKPVIVKSTSGRHGMSTFLIKNSDDLKKALLGRSGDNYLVQEFIKNDGDYRLFLIGYKIVAGFKRQKKEDKLLLNRSQGASEALSQIPENVRKEAENAAKTLGVEIAGVDCVIDEETGEAVVIEVNQAPEFYTMEKRTGIDIAEMIINYLAAKCDEKI